ncbi:MULTISPECIES: TonB-dependent receptor [Myroides]|uniref:TonB-dependent receptor n=1 Tax=Myroides TaxID=76831 RepID=UPI001324DAAD|nr:MULTISPECIES: TonB-dependent receptor [Myroides]MVX36587.1 TonB-dependent receptor plug domain-containing protein [Myroides sp. LoEW2-1]
MKLISYINKMKFKQFSFLIILIGISYTNSIYAQNTKTYKLKARVLQEGKNEKEALAQAYVYTLPSRVETFSNNKGEFSLELPKGKHQVMISYVGKVSLDTLIDVTSDIEFEWVLKDDNFRLEEIHVVSNIQKQDHSTKINRASLDHLQSLSLNDAMSLLPGGITSNPNLKSNRSISIRNIGSTTHSMNSFGTSIIQDGMPISNNANMQMMNPAVDGNLSSLGGGSSILGGIDTRNVPTDAIESIEIIKGVASAQYGDLTSGAVLFSTKKGITPWMFSAKTNPNVYQFSVLKGEKLSDKLGVLTTNFDYAKSIKSPIQSYLTYERFQFRTQYEQSFLDDRLKTNWMVQLTSSKDHQYRNYDELITQRQSKGSSLAWVFNISGTYYFNSDIFKNIKYVLGYSQTVKKSFYGQQYTSATAPYSMTMYDGSIMSNRNKDIYDIDGNLIVGSNKYQTEEDYYAMMLPSTYNAFYNIDGKEINLFGKLTSSLQKTTGIFTHNVLLGIDYKKDGNKGKGKIFLPTAPPYRDLSAFNASFRPRSYDDIPFLNQFSFFAEDQIEFEVFNRNVLINAGLRYDKYSTLKEQWSPRFNLAFDLIPNNLLIRFSHGVGVKSPGLQFLYPERAYFEYININELGINNVPEDQQLFITTTRVFNTTNKDLKVARNTKSEFTFDFQLNKKRLVVTLFKEHLKNGYSMGYLPSSFKPVDFLQYKRNDQGIYLDSSNPVLASFYQPTNNLEYKSKGVEFDFDLGKWNQIRTSFYLNGSFLESQTYSNNYSFFDGYSSTGPKERTHVGVYQKGSRVVNNQRFSTSLRLVHHIPQIGFVMTFTTEAIWKESDWYSFKDYDKPIKYISKIDGQMYDLASNPLPEEEYKLLVRPLDEKMHLKESYNPMFMFNLNLTKEVGKTTRVSFYVNNMFRSYPLHDAVRTPGVKVVRGNQFFFGLELTKLF